MRAEINFGTRCTSPKVNFLPGFTAPPIINILDSRLRGNDGVGVVGNCGAGGAKITEREGRHFYLNGLKRRILKYNSGDEC